MGWVKGGLFYLETVPALAALAPDTIQYWFVC